jgi:hypothetical protein
MIGDMNAKIDYKYDTKNPKPTKTNTTPSKQFIDTLNINNLVSSYTFNSNLKYTYFKDSKPDGQQTRIDWILIPREFPYEVTSYIHDRKTILTRIMQL